jgi:hypothetical protein
MEFSEIIIPSPLWDLLESCIECIPSCCDLDAFYVDEANIRKWVQTSELNQLMVAAEQFASILKQVHQTNLPIGCDQLGFWGTYLAEPHKLLDYFPYWDAAIKKVITDLKEEKSGTASKTAIIEAPLPR